MPHADCPTDAATPDKDRSKPTNKIVLLPLGMHRSGTSSLAGSLHLLGATLPRNLMPSKSDNQKGFFEPENIVMLNDEILASANSAWNDCGKFDISVIQEDLLNRYTRRAVSMVAEEYEGASPIVLKDPRICRMLSFWLPALEQAGYIPYVIIPVRSPLEVAQSLQARDGLSIQTGKSLWLRHVIDAEFESRASPRLFLLWDQFLADPNAILVEISQRFNLALDASSPLKHQQIEAFIDSGLRRFKEPSQHLRPGHGVDAKLGVAFAALVSLSKDPNCIEAMRLLDDLRTELTKRESHREAGVGAHRHDAANHGEHFPDRPLPPPQVPVAPMQASDAVSTDADVHVMADGRRLPALRAGTNRWQFVVPADTISLRLCSRATRLSMIDGSSDRRMLGMCVRAIEIDGVEGKQRLTLDHPAFVVGLHPVERDGHRIWRWTNGNAVLPMGLLGRGTMLLTVVGETLPRYRLEAI